MLNILNIGHEINERKEENTNKALEDMYALIKKEMKFATKVK